jgi:hypothetical protein
MMSDEVLLDSGDPKLNPHHFLSKSFGVSGVPGWVAQN